nr:hypothetical protein [Delftia acidovorans]
MKLLECSNHGVLLSAGNFFNGRRRFFATHEAISLIPDADSRNLVDSGIILREELGKVAAQKWKELKTESLLSVQSKDVEKYLTIP